MRHQKESLAFVATHAEYHIGDKREVLYQPSYEKSPDYKLSCYLSYHNLKPLQ